MTEMTTTTQSTVEEARARTERIRAGLDSLHMTRVDIADAYRAQDWTTLGYDSWEAYVSAEFVGARLRVPREERRELVSSLRSAGMSARAIASATGVGVGTVSRDLSTVPNGTVEEPPATVTGVNGKTYSASQSTPTVSDLIDGDDLAELNGGDPAEPIEAEIVDDQPAPAAPKPRRKPIADAARAVAVDGRSWARRLQRLVDDDRFGRNRQAVGGVLRAELDEVRRTVDQAQAAIDSHQ